MKRMILLTLLSIIIISSPGCSKAKMRVGVYDSRAVAIWYFRSDDYMKGITAMREEMKNAKAKGDTMLVKKLNEKGPLMQRIAHDKGFGRGSVAEILEKKADVIKAIAKKDKLSAVVSKWELNYAGSDIEQVDITVELLKALNAKDDIFKMIGEMSKVQPVEDAFFIED